MKKILIISAICVSFVCGILWQNLQNYSVIAQTEKMVSSKIIIIRAFGTANSSDRPEDHKVFAVYSEDHQPGLYVVPQGKKLVITDMMFDARYTQQDLVINLAQRNDERDSRGYKKHESIQQVSLKVGESKEIHLCTGYVIASGNSIVGWTNAGLKPKQLVLMNFTGYLVDEDTED